MRSVTSPRRNKPLKSPSVFWKRFDIRIALLIISGAVTFLALVILLTGHFLADTSGPMPHSAGFKTIVYLLLAVNFLIAVLAAIDVYFFIREHRRARTSLVDSTSNLERRAVQLQVAAEIARDATGTLDLDRILNRTVELVRESRRELEARGERWQPR